MQRYLYEFYSSVGHCGFLDHVSITFVKIDTSVLLKRKDYWRRTLCTMAPYGLNIGDHILLIPLKFLKNILMKRIFILWRTFIASRLYDKEYLMMLTSFTTVQ